MDWNQAKFWLELGMFFYMIAGSIAGWVIVKQRATQDDLDELRKEGNAQLSGYGARLTRLEEEVRHAPTHTDLGAVYEKLNEMNGELQKASGSMEGMRQQLSMINQHLMDKH